MPGAKITKIKFYSINRDVKAAVAAANYDAEEIGRKHYVSRETVNAVRRAGTWPQWERNKAEANRRRIEKARAVATAPVAHHPHVAKIQPGVAMIGDRQMQLVPTPVLDTPDHHEYDEDLVTISRSRFHYFLELERRVKRGEEPPKQKLRLWGRR